MPVSTPPSRSPPPQTLAAPRPRVLVVDDELSMAETLADGLIERGYDAVPVGSSRQAAKMLEDRSFVALVTDLRMPELDGLELLATSRRLAPERPVIVMTAYSALDTAIESIRRGAYHYATKPFKLDEIALFLGRALDEVGLRRETTSLKRALRERYALANLVGESAAMREVADLVERVADASVPVLLLGETGTGKGLVARAIHAQGSRASAPFVSVNCAAIPEALLESELFGHAKGAFTGATNARAGLFADADGGTLFLDEIGEMSAALQAKLLHVLESGVVRGVGEAKERAIDVRFLTATHRDLRARVASGEFREDLMYRLEVVTIELPPLRHRKDDLPALIQHFLARARDRHRASIVERFSPEALDQLLAHPWPGNVRELEHVVERVVLLGRTSEVTLADLPSQLRAKQAEASPVFGEPVLPMREMQRRYAAWAYEHFGGRKLLTAERLGIDDKTLTSWLGKREPREPREPRE
jgi:two-component system response regulator HydG